MYKPTFGGASTSAGFGGFGSASPFGGQNAFGKPATPGFGQTSTFGQQQNTSLFGASQPPAGGGLFGAAASTSFGAPTATTQSQFGFGQTQPQNTSLFGAAQQPQQNTSLFGQPSTSAFGAAKPTAFGFGTQQPSTSLFGQASTSTAAAGSSFGGFGNTNTNTSSMFGAAATTPSAFGQPTPSGSGSSIAKYQPSLGSDTLLKNGQTNNVSTKQHCITAMKEYEGKSLEEIRMEDYLANRKGPQAGAVAPGGLFGSTAPANTSLFGNTAAQPSAGLFGQPAQPTANTLGGFGSTTNTLGGFGQQTSAFGQTTTPQSSSLFAKPFGAPATSTAPFGGFGTAAANNNPFGAKPAFGQPAQGGLFGQPAATAASTFGQPSSAFQSFGQTNTNQPSLFGPPATSNAGAFGLTSSAPNTGFGGFGTANTSTAGGLFGQKPATGFGAPGTFGTTTSASTGFGTFGQTNTSGSLFNNSFNKPAGSTFGGFGTQAAAPTLGTGLTGLGTQPGQLFGNTANKPLGGSLFGQNTTAQPGGLFGSTFGQTNTLGSGLGQNTLGGFGTTLGTNQQPATVPIHQQIMALTTSPYGDNPIFKDLKPPGLSEDALKPTNPAAQKPILDSNFKVSPKSGGPSIKLRPVGSMLSKKPLFNGLEEFDSSVESFTLKPNAKRLIIKPKSANSPSVQQSHAKPSSVNQNDSSKNLSPAASVSGTPGTPIGQLKDSFRNNIPTGDISASDPDAVADNRRASWLHSKTSKPLRNVEFQQNNTIDEFFGPAGGTAISGQNQKENISAELHSEPGSYVRERESTVKMPMKSIPISANDSILDMGGPSTLDESNLDLSLVNTEANAAGVILQRSKYYTIPPLDKLVDFMREDGSCIVPNFTIGRKGYGNVFFNESIDIAGLNLDELVHFRHKEVIIYPDDENKPPVGTELNRKAQITLDQVWPHDKTLHEPIRDKDRLEAMDFEGKLRRVCDKHDMRFIEYRPETGSWVFRVNHFSKYGLSDSDEDETPDPKKAKMAVQQTVSVGPIGLDANKMKATGTIPKDVKKVTEKESDMNITAQGLGGLTSRFENGEYNIDPSVNAIDSNKLHPTSPSAVLAMDMGADSHKVQLMKASFFNDDEFDGKSVVSEQLDGRDSPDQIVPTKPFFLLGISSTHSISKGSGSSVVEMATESPLPIIKEAEKKKVEPEFSGKLVRPIGPKSLPLIVKPIVALVKIPGTVIPFAKSLANRLNGKCASDVAFLHSKRFKIGWGLQTTMMILSTANNCQNISRESNIDHMKFLFQGRSSLDNSRAILQNIKLLSTQHIPRFAESIEGHLMTQLELCRKIETGDCPHLITDGGTILLNKHFELAASNLSRGSIDEYAVSVWSLCNALWGDQEELDGQDTSSHLTIMRRKELLSEWLENVITSTDVPMKPIQNENGYLEHLLTLLSHHKVSDAGEFAFNNNDMNLALLIAQLSGGPTVRQLIHHQLASWQEVEADKFIAVNRLKVFMLLAGIPLLSSMHGTINIYEDFDWLKSFALHIWYLCSATSSITDALIAYEKAFKSDDFRAMSPTPPYINEYQPQNATHNVEDLRYHILKLYSKRSHPLESLLNPATHTSDPMDFRLSWLLMESLKTIGYHHCSELAESQLHTSFASQLENYGMWHWAVFILLHIPNTGQRELSVQNLLYRYITISDDEEYLIKEKFVIEELHVPLKWIYWAKAVRAGAMRKYHAQADYLLKAKQWARAHDVIMNQIAPDAVINDNMEYLRELLERFEDPRLVPNWSNQGMILLDYMDISKKFESLKTIHEDDIETRWEGLKPQLSELFSRINQFPCHTAKQRLCQSEIAQRLANLVSGVRIMCPELDPCILTQATLKKLPLPQEFAQQKMRALMEDRNLEDVLQQRLAS